MTSLLRRFDEDFPMKEGAQTFSGKRAKDWLRTALGELIVEMQGEKVAEFYDNSEYVKGRNGGIDDCIALLAKSLDEGK